MFRSARALGATAAVALATAGIAAADTLSAPVLGLTLPVESLDLSRSSLDGSVSIEKARVVVQSDVLFAFGSARLSGRAGAQLQTAADELVRRRARAITVDGHTDSRGSVAYNLRLSRRRSKAVRNALGARLDGVVIRASGRGEAAPVASNASAHGRALNRRVEIRFR